MGQVTLSVGGYSYQVNCRDGEEDHLLKLGDIVDGKVSEAKRAVGSGGEARHLLLAALLFADEALEIEQSGWSPDLTTGTDDRVADSLEAAAARLESLAAALEN